MNKREVVELESAFLEFCNIAQDLGYKFEWKSVLELHHESESPHSMNGKVTLDPKDFIKKD
jgi:hypothetical protein